MDLFYAYLLCWTRFSPAQQQKKFKAKKIDDIEAEILSVVAIGQQPDYLSTLVVSFPLGQEKF